MRTTIPSQPSRGRPLPPATSAFALSGSSVARWMPMLVKPIANPWIATPTIEARERRAVVSPSAEARTRCAATSTARKAKKPTPSTRSPGSPTGSPAIDSASLIASPAGSLCRLNATSLSQTSIYTLIACSATERANYDLCFKFTGETGFTYPSVTGYPASSSKASNCASRQLFALPSAACRRLRLALGHSLPVS